MKFFIDENLPPPLRDPMAKVYRHMHSFYTAQQTGLRGVDDADLFRDLALQDFDAIITQDARQLEIPTERDGLRDNGLHWIGVPAIKAKVGDNRVKGESHLAFQAAAILAGLAHVLATWHAEPHAYRLRPIGSMAPAEIEPL